MRTETIEACAARYLGCKLAPESAVRAYAQACLDASLRLPVRVEVVDASPYPDAATMTARVRTEGVLYVWSGACEGLAWDAAANRAARAVHDWYDHVQNPEACALDGYEVRGEAAAARSACARWPGLAPLVWSEVVGQRCYLASYGTFHAEQRPAWLEPVPIETVGSRPGTAPA